ncbi:response regulator [Aureimonas jatrophae]|jgi:two-component system, chemotaxis family, chemotaxis protein CheY|uniref:Two-component system, chemotaxis family, response regulator CheY n=1 Tax=Aureimonas jatrophae TaxID=1166073 RepID=A0A1H0CKN1_9HYPH|nr:response regulator [Aureimonas jatrophae]MBB3949275.1 two-component system chemotaxis response regulator CheY [Aureimonas jatrophae]SDN58382.1 two-component system, chemotaxis family, response regulator CheY [Aureimonas jatrophae]
MPLCLIIDESEIVVKVAARILSGIDMDAVGASTASAGLALLPGREKELELVILSGALPDSTVEANVRALRAAPATAQVPILVSVVETNLGLMTRAKRAGASGFVFRPFDRASLLAWVDRHLTVAA